VSQNRDTMQHMIVSIARWGTDTKIPPTPSPEEGHPHRKYRRIFPFKLTGELQYRVRLSRCTLPSERDFTLTSETARSLTPVAKVKNQAADVVASVATLSFASFKDSTSNSYWLLLYCIII
jgi:hypothetical protein